MNDIEYAGDTCETFHRGASPAMVERSRRPSAALFLLAVCALLLVLSSCSDGLLDIENPNQQTSESFWSNGDQALQGVNAAYEPLT